MNFIVAVATDIGISKTTNQDSIGIKIAETKYGKAALIVICDGMGGLSKGELASATVIRSLTDWFECDFPNELDRWNWETVSNMIVERIQNLHLQILTYAKTHNVKMGTTVTGMLIVRTHYISFHVGDTRIYEITNELHQLTKDQTYFERDLKPLIQSGKLTVEEAMQHPKHNALLQGIGASKTVNPEIRYGNLNYNANYMFCSDGFRHVLSENELIEYLSPSAVYDKKTMQNHINRLIEIIKERNERDNISVILVRAEV